jgi:hypothetical protein
VAKRNRELIKTKPKRFIMPIDGAELVVGATGASVTGGTAVTMIDDSLDIPNGIHVLDSTSVVSPGLRPHTTFRSKQASYANGKHQKGKREATHVRPKLLADGTPVYPLVRITIEPDYEMTDAELLELQMQGVQHFIDTEFANFWKFGSRNN